MLIIASPKTLDHSAKARLVVIITLVCPAGVLAQPAEQVELQRPAGQAEGQAAQFIK